MDASTLLGLLLVAIIEPLLVLVIAPRITTRHVEARVDGLLDDKVRPMLAETVQAAMEEAMPDQSGARLSAQGVAARERYALSEEKLVAAAVAKYGPQGKLLVEMAKAEFPAHWKAAVRAGPAAAEQAVGSLAALAPKTAGHQQQAVAYL